MKNQIFATLTVSIILLSAIFINLGNAATQTGLILPASGTIANNITITSSTLPLFESFENGLSNWQQSFMDNYILQTTTAWAYDKTYSLYCGSTTNDRYAKLSKDLNGTFRTLYASEIVKPTSWNIGNDRGAYFLGISQNDTSTSYLALLGIYNINGQLQFALQYQIASGINRIATSSVIPTINDTYYLMLKVVVDQSVGEVVGYINGTSVLNANFLNNAVYKGDSVIECGWMGSDSASNYVNQGTAYIDDVQANTDIIIQPPYSPISQPSSLTVWTNGAYYSANSTSDIIFFGGPSNVRNVNGLSFGDVVSNSCQTVSKITILAGNYVQDKPINCFGNNFITGAGNSTYIVASQTIGDNSEAFYCNGVSNVTIANMWLDGNPANYFINTFGVLTMYSSGIWVHDCTFSNYNLGTSCGIDVCWTTNSTFENNVCFNIGGAGIWIDIGSSTYVVRNNVVVGNLSGTSNLGIALVFFDDYGNHPGLVTGNTITGNFTWYGLEVYWGSGTTKPYGVTISNNTIHGGNGNRYQSGIWLYRASNCTVENNIIEYNTGSSNNGVLLSDCDHISITNNTLRYNNGAGIYVSTELNQYNTINQNDMRYNVYPTFDNVNLTKDTVVLNTIS